jgi:hypothetical protein
LSDIAKFSSTNIKAWLERETHSIFVPVHAKAEKLRDETRKALQNLTDSSKMLLDNSAKEIEKKNMRAFRRAKALNKLARLFLERLGKIKIPDQVSYESLHKFAQETQQVLAVTEIDIRNWFPRISPFFILDRRRFQVVFERTKETVRELNSFATKEYVKTKTLEETFDLVERLQAHEQQLVDLKGEKARVQSEKVSVEREIADTNQRMLDLKSKGAMSQLSQVDAEIEALTGELKHSLRHLQKPFIKLQSLSLHGEGSRLTPDELKKLEQYLEDPFESFSKEAVGYEVLKEILRKLSRSMSEGKLNLKSDKQRKAEQAIDSALNKDSLASLHQECTVVAMRREKLLESAELEVTRLELVKLQSRLEELERRKDIIESEENSVNRACGETAEKIQSTKSSIEKNVLDFMGKRITLQ